ncbi:hypothetical protein EJ05DRAFT_495692 [Pseudovirgaria hyperparasitica]|uniref:Uncharacterized protein n=1 Tax=Pseudovirgaria hyperparasitica TaxID=470096 RepID=A0A6A6WKY2_9PEZI|nr:uncharacterized protein EJ05DRAFT_495692 [Pseudovirgaria hyperparasitica]KAF2762837.1 hypothetical protein EJ05DRAFT_495692 [Pseudovirgaria hyperparasitica]
MAKAVKKSARSTPRFIVQTQASHPRPDPEYTEPNSAGKRKANAEAVKETIRPKSARITTKPTNAKKADKDPNNDIQMKQINATEDTREFRKVTYAATSGVLSPYFTTHLTAPSSTTTPLDALPTTPATPPPPPTTIIADRSDRAIRTSTKILYLLHHTLTPTQVKVLYAQSTSISEPSQIADTDPCLALFAARSTALTNHWTTQILHKYSRAKVRCALGVSKKQAGRDISALTDEERRYFWQMLWEGTGEEKEKEKEARGEETEEEESVLRIFLKPVAEVVDWECVFRGETNEKRMTERDKEAVVLNREYLRETFLYAMDITYMCYFDGGKKGKASKEDCARMEELWEKWPGDVAKRRPGLDTLVVLPGLGMQFELL